VGVDEVGAEGGHDPGRQERHEATQYDEVGLPRRELIEQGFAPRAATGKTTEGKREARDAELLGVSKTVGIAVGADRNDAGRELGVFGCVEQVTKIGAAPRDEYHE
jgi:hypothetical protein